MIDKEHDLIKDLQRVSNESGQLEGKEKRIFAKALLYLVLKVSKK